MKARSFFSMLTLCTLVSAGTALAHEPKNLKVISKEIKEKELENAMKDINKGLGVKCEACHVKGKKEEDHKGKDAGREFFKATLGDKDPAKRKAALDSLLKELKLEAAKNEKLIWDGVDKLRKQ